MAQAVVLGVDLGTTGVRVLAVTDRGEVIAETTREYPLLTPRPGWTEQRPEDWTVAATRALEEVAAATEGHDIVALGLSGQMHGMVPLGAGGEVVRPAILWNDQRTAGAVEEMEARIPREIFVERTGNPPITGFHAAKLLWLRREEPENFARTRHSLLPKDYLGYALTGEMRAEPSDASGSNCFNLNAKAWDEEILGALELPSTLFPEVVASHQVTGRLRAEIAERVGLPAGLQVVAGAGDNAAAATGLGLGAHDIAIGSVSLGTSGVVFAPLGQATPDPAGRVHLFCHADGGYHLLGVTLAAAGSLQWFKRTFAPEQGYDELTRQAAASPPGANGVTFKPYLAGERTPFLNPDLRGSFSGLSLATSREDVIRAVLEGVAFSLRDALDVMKPLTSLRTCLATGGGARSDLWLQMVADALEVTVTRPAENRGAAYGAALLALKGVGLVARTTEVARTAQEARFEPEPKRYREALARYRS